ncbi:MAG: dipeptide ABC transporter ATP-binding protein [Lachnospiraceae bacterium]|nr:dipeptide ABC transporter ATP-binding protein [Lachnospiraceae bacterium]
MEEKKVVLSSEHVSQFFPIKNGFGQVVNYVKAVDGVTLELHEGETYGLVGETGCGKSTLGRTLIRLLEPTEGNVVLNGEDISHLSEKEMRKYRKEVQMVFQDPYTSLNPRQKVGDILMEVLEIHGVKDKDERMEIAMKMLAKVGLRPEHFYRYPHEFSGGQRQRVGLARALILNPKVIICDEPVSALDVSIQAQIINLLQDLQKEDKLSYLFIAHDMSVVKYISDRIGVMYLGHLMEEAETEELFSNTLHPYAQALLSAVPNANPHEEKQRIVLEGDLPSPINPPTGCVFHTRCPYAKAICSEKIPVLKSVNEKHKVACLLYDKDLNPDAE